MTLTEQTKAKIRIGLMVAVFVLLVGSIFYFKPIWAKVLFGILAAALGWLLVRIFLSMRRKKYYVEGKVLSITAPKNKLKFGKTWIVFKVGKASKKLCSWQPVKMKVGNVYGIYFEEKSNHIIKYDSMKMTLSAKPKGGLPPQYR